MLKSCRCPAKINILITVIILIVVFTKIQWYSCLNNTRLKRRLFLCWGVIKRGVIRKSGNASFLYIILIHKILGRVALVTRKVYHGPQQSLIITLFLARAHSFSAHWPTVYPFQFWPFYTGAASYRCHTRIPFHFKIRAQKSPLGWLLRVPNGLFDFLKKKINLATTYSHIAFRYTTIGATVFHFRVRNGTGWCHCAMATRSLLRDKFRNRILATDHSIKNGSNVRFYFSLVFS